MLLALLAGVPAGARAQAPALPTAPTIAPAPPVETHPAPPPLLQPPTAPPSRPAGPGPTPLGDIDRTKSYFVFVDQVVDIAGMRGLRKQLGRLADAGVGEITIVLDSVGGLVLPALDTYDFIRALPCQVNIHAQGFVMSAATILFLAGAQRSASPFARFVFHPMRTQVAGSLNDPELRDILTNFAATEDVLAQILRDRTRLSDATIASFQHQEVIYTADQALAAGIVQRVAPLAIPGEQKSRIIVFE